MSSAVESFGPASAAAAHPYAHHNPYAIAAAAAAAGSAAAAAAAVIPSHHHHHHLLHHHQSIKAEPGLDHQFVINHSSIYNNISVSAANSHISNSILGNGSGSDLFLPPPRPPTLSLTTSSLSSSPLSSTSLSSSANTNILPTPLALSSKTSLTQERPNSPQNRSPRSTKASNFQGQDSICPNNNNMSSAEFARPHPKQPRYNNSNNNNNNNVNTTNNNNNNSHVSYNNNAIPIHLRSTNKTGTNLSKGYNLNLNNNNNCLNNNNVSASDKNSNNGSIKLSNNNNNNHLIEKSSSVAMPRAKYSNEQSGPVNLVTTNNINLMNQYNNNNNTSNNCRTPPSSIPPEVTQVSPSSSESSDCSRKSAKSSEMYPMKMPFRGQSLTVTSDPAIAAAACAAAYQYNYPHIYASRALYGTSALFPGHHALVHHNTLRPCPTYLGGQHEAFSPYLQVDRLYQNSVPTNVAPPPPSAIGLLRTTNSQVLLNNNSNNNGISVVASKPSSPLERNSSYPPPSNPKDINNMNGTYLNGKVNTSPAAPESVSGFKVPSGKEGSLKHRILTRPAPSDRESSKRRSPITAAVVKTNNNSSTSNFTKGAFIELANGALRRVEDMRTEDFIQSAEKSAFHQLAESTVVKIIPTQSSVIITFSYDKNRSKADVEVSQEHPFFVYGQGWASCNPDLTLKSFGLKCQRLQVGDICISLISKEQQQPQTPQAQDKHHHHQSQITAANISNNNHQAPSQNFDKSEPISLPQNLSRKLQQPPAPAPAPPTSADNSIPLNNVVSNRLASMGAPTYIPNSLPQHHPYNEESAAAAYENTISRHHEFYQPPLHLHHPYHRLLGHHTEVTSRLSLPPPPPPPQSHSAPVQKSRPPSNQSSYYPEPHHSPPSSSSSSSSNSAAQNSCSNETQQQPVDASLSRKRRWSAPESICDDDENECQPPTAPRLSSNVNAYNS